VWSLKNPRGLFGRPLPDNYSERQKKVVIKLGVVTVYTQIGSMNCFSSPGLAARNRRSQIARFLMCIILLSQV